MGVLLVLQTTPETTSAPQEVTIAPAQMAQIGEQINGVGYYVGGLLGVAVLCLGAIAMIVAVRGN